MKISICLTTFNEGGTVADLLDSLLNQTKKPDEIVIIDGGSNDNTIEIIRHYQQKDGKIKLLVEKCSRARGRNLGVEIAKNNIIAITDAGCVAHHNWLEEITKPFENEKVDISAGFYKMVGKNALQKAMSVFLGVTPRKFSVNFLPSTRSIAFKKSAWEAVGGFPEGKENSAEDTDFNYKAVKLGLKYSRVKTALVEWGMPESLGEFEKKIFSYAKWDAKYGIWWHPSQGFTSHNIKALFVLIRYILGASLVLFSFSTPLLFSLLLILLLLYFFWSYRKVYLEFGDYRVAFWGPVLQIVSDVAVMRGFVWGLLTFKG